MRASSHQNRIRAAPQEPRCENRATTTKRRHRAFRDRAIRTELRAPRGATSGRPIDRIIYMHIYYTGMKGRVEARLSEGIELQAPKYEDRIISTSQQGLRKSRSTNGEPQEACKNRDTRDKPSASSYKKRKRVEESNRKRTELRATTNEHLVGQRAGGRPIDINMIYYGAEDMEEP